MQEGAGPRAEVASAGASSRPDAKQRRSERLLLTVPICVEGKDTSGRIFRENSRTLVINREGARIQLRHAVSPGVTLQITTLAGNRQGKFRLVGPTKPPSEEGGEWGVECLEENKNIWGIAFPPPARDQSSASAVLECRGCSEVALTPLSLVEHDVLTSSGLLSRECKTCGQITAWGYTEKQLGVPPPGQNMAPAIAEILDPPPPKSERRKHPRVALKLPIRVQSYYAGEEFAKSENLSKGGLCFVSSKMYQIGEVLLVTCPYNPGGHNIEVRSEVVYRHEMKGTGRYILGVRYQK